MMEFKTSPRLLPGYAHDWNNNGRAHRPWYIHFDKRDGEQGRLAKKPTLEQSIRIIELTHAAGVDNINIGFPTEKRKGFEDLVVMANECLSKHMRPRMLARPLEGDIQPIVEIQKKSKGESREVEICIFQDVSRIRMAVEKWAIEDVEENFKSAVKLALENRLNVWIGLENASRTNPEILKRIAELFRDFEGVNGFVLADTIGYLNPTGAFALFKFMREQIGDERFLEFHPHDDCGLAIANSLAALQAGADGIHATWLGMGERAGNVDLVELALNMYLHQATDAGRILHDWISLLAAPHDNGGFDFHGLLRWEEKIAEIYGAPIKRTTFRDPEAFRTYVGTHARTILKALLEGGINGANIVFSPFDPSNLGYSTRAGIGPYSSEANVILLVAELLNIDISKPEKLQALERRLTKKRIPERILEFAVGENRNLKADEVLSFLKGQGFSRRI